jgi:hypothetical protein
LPKEGLEPSKEKERHAHSFDCSCCIGFAEPGDAE